ncbi:MAG: hypothetical protein FJ038_07515 [Chloroflexi bacterium]|nr:hypothetical protein [Chloroflexota bacterium]
MRLLREAGVRRVNWLSYGSIDPASPLYSPILARRRHGPATIARLGDPLAAAVHAAHANGMELYAVMKPFAGATVTSHATPPEDGRALPRIGGWLDDPYAWLQGQPAARIARDPSTIPARPAPRPSDIAAIRLTKSDDTPTRITAADLEFHTSRRNDRYRRRRHLETFTVREEVRPAPAEVRDYFGRVVTRAGAPVRSLVLENVHLDDPFTLVTTRLRDGEPRAPGPDFRNTARHMIEALDRDGRPIRTVVATRSATANLNRDFRRQGLEFDCGYGLFQYALDADNRAQSAAWDTPQGGCIAFALGVNETLGGAPCESVPAIQDAWLAWLRSLIAAGVDGVDIRISAHGTHTDEPFAYGFNPEVLAAAEIEPAATTMEGPARPRPGERPDLATIARVRGDVYTQFLRRAREALRAAGLPLQVHLHTEAFRPNPVHGQLMGFPAKLEFGWREWLASGLVDSATLRTAWYERLGPPIDDLGELLRESFVEETIVEARRHGVPLYLNRYAMDGNTRRTGVRADRYLEDFEFAFRDERLDGFDLYELWALAGPSADGSRVEPLTELLPRVGRLARRLGIT